MYAYARDGESYRHGFLGTGLQRAVRGNARAEHAAREYHDRQRDGLLFMLGGLVCSSVAFGYAIKDYDSTDNKPPAALWVSVGCLLAGLAVGPAWVASAEPFRWDAINLFNDTPMLPGAPGYGAISGRKRITLRPD